MASPYSTVASDYAAALGNEPDRIIRPITIDEVAETIGWADRTKQAVIPWGGGGGQTYGYLPRTADVLLNLRGLNRVVSHEPGDLVVTVEAGTTLTALQDLLAKHNQFLPLDPPEPSRTTIGGLLATNAFGPSRTHHGTARDWLIGLTVIDAQGRLIKGGGKVVKNVTGYDIPKLHIGALGTLGVIVEATFKVAPRPDMSMPLLFRLPESRGAGANGLDVAARTVSRIVVETAPALGLIRDANGARIAAFIYSGTNVVVECQRNLALELAEAAPDLVPIGSLPAGMGRPFTNEAPPPGANLVLHVGGMPATELSRHAELSALFSASLLRIDTFPGSGQTVIALNGDDDLQETARAAIAWAENAGARIAFLHAPMELRQSADTFPLWSPLPPSLALMRRLKAALDPNGTLNPGRFVDGM